MSHIQHYYKLVRMNKNELMLHKNLNNSVDFTESIPANFVFNLPSKIIEARSSVYIFFKIVIVMFIAVTTVNIIIC